MAYVAWGNPAVVSGSAYKPKKTTWNPAVVPGSAYKPKVTPAYKPKVTPAGTGGGGTGGGIPEVTSTGGSTGASLQDWLNQIRGMLPQSSNIQMPAPPQEPVITQEMIKAWQQRAMEEAGLTYDPQILAIQQELDKAILAAQQAKAGIAPSYQEVIDNIKKWQEEQTKAEQERAYARGFGQGGGLMQTETDIAKEALKQQTGALTEKARKESDIEAQIQQLKEQAGQKITSAEEAKAKYIAARRADLEDAYKQQKAQLDRQNFANQMAIAQFGLTKESQDFQNWLNTMSLATDMWYKDQSLSLNKMAQELGAKAQEEALNWEKTKYYDTQARNAAATATTNKYENMVWNPETKTYMTNNDYTNWKNADTAWKRLLAEINASKETNPDKEADAMAAWIAKKELEQKAQQLGYYNEAANYQYGKLGAGILP